MATPDTHQTMMLALNKLAKWRTVFASWFFGTRSDTDQQCKAFKDLVERTLVLRVELTALNRLLIEKGIFAHYEIMEVITDEAAELEKMLEVQFPGFRATQSGIKMDLREIHARGTMTGWPA